MKKVLLTSSFFISAMMSSNAVYAKDIADQSAQREAQAIEVNREDFHPAFTKATVIKLNAIVSRSLEVIDEYDLIMSELRLAKQESTAGQIYATKIKGINELSEQSKLILSEMLVAESELKASDEIFNDAILAGMKKFVIDVEREVSAQSALLSQTLSKR